MQLFIQRIGMFPVQFFLIRHKKLSLKKNVVEQDELKKQFLVANRVEFHREHTYALDN